MRIQCNWHAHLWTYLNVVMSMNLVGGISHLFVYVPVVRVTERSKVRSTLKTCSAPLLDVMVVKLTFCLWSNKTIIQAENCFIVCFKVVKGIISLQY